MHSKACLATGECSSGSSRCICQESSQLSAALSTGELLQIMISCCRHSEPPQQASGAAAESTSTPIHGATHPLADTASQVKPDQTSSEAQASSSAGRDQPSSSRQPAGLSDELVDLFGSIQQLQQEVAALPQPQQVLPAAGAQSGLSTDQVLHLHSLTPCCMLTCPFCIFTHSYLHAQVVV